MFHAFRLAYYRSHVLVFPRFALSVPYPMVFIVIMFWLLIFNDFYGPLGHLCLICTNLAYQCHARPITRSDTDVDLRRVQPVLENKPTFPNSPEGLQFCLDSWRNADR